MDAREPSVAVCPLLLLSKVLLMASSDGAILLGIPHPDVVSPVVADHRRGRRFATQHGGGIGRHFFGVKPARAAVVGFT